MKMCRFVKILVLVVVMGGNANLTVNSQMMPSDLAHDLMTINPMLSPEASSFTKYGKIPVGHTTGTANISIPIHSIEVGDISMPITLSYHTSGIKVDDDATWVGLGWALNCGGVITRQINDLPDEVRTKIGDMRHLLDKVDNKSPIIENLWFSEMDKRISDKQYDSFFFSLFGESGSFHMDDLIKHNAKYNEDYNVEGYLDKENGMNIRMINQRNTYGFVGDFEIIKDGYIYLFTQKEYVLQGSQSQTRFNQTESSENSRLVAKPVSWQTFTPGHLYDQWGTPMPHCNAWYLTSITSPSGRKVTLEYKKTEKTKRNNISTHDAFGTMGVNYSRLSEKITAFSRHRPTINRSLTLDVTEFPQGQLYVSKIIFDGGVMEFNSSLGRKDANVGYKLDNIKIKTNRNIDIKSIDFKYSYFEAIGYSQFCNFFTKTEDKFRLKLTNVTINAEEYSFEYNEEKLPPRHSFSKDWEGYYNGAYNATLNPRLKKQIGLPSLYMSMGILKEVILENPSYIINTVEIGDVNVSREPNLVKMKAGVLTKIIYPTKGYTIFDYQNHKAKNYVFSNDIKDVGGLKIHTIKNYDINGKFIEGKRYEYSPGMIYQMTVADPLRHAIIDCRKDNLLPLTKFYHGATTIVDIYGKTELTPFEEHCTYSQYRSSKFCSPYDAGVSYTDVTEYIIDHKGNTTGGIKYKYSYEPDLVYAPDNSAAQFTSNSYLRGNLEEMTVIDKDGKTVQKTEYKYSEEDAYDSTDPNYNLCLLQIYEAVFNHGPTLGAYSKYLLYENVQYAWIPLKSIFYNMTSKKITDYINGEAVAQEIKYDWKTSWKASNTGAMNRLQREVVTNSMNNTMESIYTYYRHNRSGSQDTGLRILASYRPLTEKQIYTNGLLTYQEKIEYLDLKPSKVLTRYRNMGDLVLEVEYLKYDKYRNPTHIRTKGGLNIVQIWGREGQYLLARIENATYNEVEVCLGRSIDTFDYSLEITESSLKALREKLPSAYTTSYSYAPMIGIISETNSAGIKATYHYDAIGRLGEVRDMESNLLKKYNYHYAYNDKSYSTIEIEAKLDRLPLGSIHFNFHSNAKETFTAKIVGNSEEVISVSWYIIDRDINIGSALLSQTKYKYEGNMDSFLVDFSSFPTNKGRRSLSIVCEARGNNTGKLIARIEKNIEIQS